MMICGPLRPFAAHMHCNYCVLAAVTVTMLLRWPDLAFAPVFEFFITSFTMSSREVWPSSSA